MKNRFVQIWLLLFFLVNSLQVFSQRKMENLNHGLLAVKTSSGVLVSWRVLAWELKDVAYNLYRDGSKINTTPIDGATNYLDASGTTTSNYQLKLVVKGVEQAEDETCAVWAQNSLDIPVRPIDGVYNTYHLNDASVGDLDGDGQYEIIVKRLALNKDVSSTDYHYLEAYKLDGTLLWAVNMGPNIYNDVEFNFLVYDFNGDGKAEVALRTSDGFIDGVGVNIGDADGDGITNYRYSVSSVGYRMEGPDYLSVLDGESGAELDRVNYIPRGNITDWGRDDGGHRSTKCMFTIAYLDGVHPDIVIGRGIYERIAMAAWSFRDASLSQKWYFDSNNNPAYAQQGYHNLTQGDVDNDGCDEIVYGSMCIDNDGTGLYSTGLGHGDAQHLADINPNRKGLEFFGCLENSAGGDYRDAGTGEILFYKNIGRDMGRCGSADITPDYPGMEMWGPSGFPFLSSTGSEITSLTPPSSMNFFIWWDGDLSRELLDHAWYGDYGVGTITKYNNGANTQLLYADGTLSDNWTKGNPGLSADILGDWREEVIWRTNDNSVLRIYTTPYTTTVKIYTLMHDPQYRAAIAWQPNSYNQPPHPSFFIGNDMDSIPPAPIVLPGQMVYSGGSWDVSSTSWAQNGTAVSFTDGDSLLFDISGTQSNVELIGSLSPEDIRFISPNDFTFSGDGVIAGETDLTKAGSGNLSIETNNTFSGTTRVWEGMLTLSGELNSAVFVKRFATLAGSGKFRKGITVEPYAELIISNQQEEGDSLFVDDHLTLSEKSIVYMDLSDDIDAVTKVNDIIIIDGDLNITGKISLTINRLDGKLTAGTYVLAKYTGSFNGSVDNVSIKGIPGLPYTLTIDAGEVKLEVADTRLPGKVVWKGYVDKNWNLFNTLNWDNQGVEDYFLGEDSVVFDNTALQNSVLINGEYAVSDFLCDADNTFVLGGTGKIAGDGTFTKRGTGLLAILNGNSYTGPTIIEEGTLLVNTLANGGYNSPIGASAADASNLIINGGELKFGGFGEVTTDRSITLGNNDGAINIGNSGGRLVVKGSLVGEGDLVKNGTGILCLETVNSHSGTVINSGIIQLLDDAANINGLGDTLTLNGGTLAMLDNSYSYTDNCGWHIVVPEGKTGTLKLDSRSSLTGKLLGKGTLNLYSPWIRNDLKGDWSNFEGVINVTTDGDGGDFRIYNNYGFTKATVNINPNLYVYNQAGGAVNFGALNSEVGATMAPGTYKVGYNNSDAVFKGVFTGSTNVSKYGEGNWTLTNANEYSGSTTVYAGTLIVGNTSGSATGSSIVTVRNGATISGSGIVSGSVSLYGLMSGEGTFNGTVSISSGGVRIADNTINGALRIFSNGTLSGEGNINGVVTLYSGAIIAPGIDGVGTINCQQAFTLVEGCILHFEVDKGNGVNDLVVSQNSITLAGELNLSEINGTAFEAGDSFKLFDASSVEGSFSDIVPAAPGDGLIWDLSKLNTDGIIEVAASTGLGNATMGKVSIYPNPTKGIFNIELESNVLINSVEIIDLQGQVVKLSSEVQSSELSVDASTLSSGIYFVFIHTDKGLVKEKLLISK
nr:autotransporter-associated beta strand repeat-containing protein [uncultured Carboxylicivirga sp.]